MKIPRQFTDVSLQPRYLLNIWAINQTASGAVASFAASWNETPLWFGLTAKYNELTVNRWSRTEEHLLSTR